MERSPASVPRMNSFEHAGWKFSIMQASISAVDEIKQFEMTTHIHAPEMLYLSNSLNIKHKSSGLTIRADASSALQRSQQRFHELGGVTSAIKVPASKKWSEEKLRDELRKSGIGELVAIEFKYDWSYTSDYMGTIKYCPDDNDDDRREIMLHSSMPPKTSSECFIENTEEKLPVDLLMRQDPILFFTSFPLWEDELHDNGISIFQVKFRVMETFFLVLLQFYLRVDQVLYRIYETRIFHKFDTNYIIREHLYKESPVDAVRATAQDSHDAMIISKKLKLIDCKRQKIVLRQ